MGRTADWEAVASVTVPMVLVVNAGVATTTEATASRLRRRGRAGFRSGRAACFHGRAAVIGLFLDGATRR